MRLRIAVLGIVSVLGLVSPSAALAAEGEATVDGRGWLHAYGTGHATLDMKGSLRMRIDGDVVIDDLAGDMTVEITSGPAPESLGPEIVLHDFHGTILVRGSHFVVDARGRMSFTAHGAGVAHLEGRGVYGTRGGRPHPWSPGGADIELA